MKKLIVLIMIAVMAAVILSGCGAGKEAEEDRLQVVATIFPEYDWANQVLGEDSGAEVTLLVKNGADIHSYQPSAEDIMKISICDVFIYVGGESDKWVEDALKNAVNKNMKVIDLLDVLGDKAREEETVEGMQAEEESEEEEAEEETEYDEHVWLSVKNAEVFVQKICDVLSEADSGSADKYEKNTEEYIGRLKELDKQYSEAVKSAGKDTLVFGDRFPFRYLTDDYGIRYYAAFTGCSAETEASFETVRFLAEKVDEYKLGYVMTIDGSDGKIADTVIDNTKEKNQKTLQLDSMQSVTEEEIKSGASYLDVMKDDLEVLKKALA